MSNAQITIVANANVSNAVQGFQQLNQAGTQAANTLAKVPSAAGRATESLTNLGRIAQDLPFGFIGIQNNLNPMLESFQRLKAETGSTGAALKAMGSSLLGAGGVGFALSAITAAVTFASIGFEMWSRNAAKAVQATDPLVKSAEKWEQSLSGINKGIAEEVGKVSTIVGLLNQHNLTRKEQVAAVEQLNKINPEYFGGLDKEKASLDQINVAYKGYIDNLQKEMEAKALDIKLQELFNKRLDISENLRQYQELTIRIKDIQKELAASQRRDPITGQIDIGKITRLTLELGKLQAQSGQAFAGAFGKDILNATNQLPELDKEIQKIIADRVKLGNQGLITVDPVKIKTATDLLKEQRAELEKQLRLLQEIDKAGKLPTFRQPEIANLQLRILNIDAKLDKLPAENVEIKKDIIEEALNKKLAATPFTIKLGNVIVDTGAGFEQVNARQLMDNLAKGIDTQLATQSIELRPTVEIKPQLLKDKSLDAFLKEAKRLIEGFVIDEFAGLGDAIGQAIASGNGGLQQGINSMINILAGFLDQLGKTAIAFGVAKAGLNKALEFGGNGGLAIVAGVALIAASAALKASMSKQHAFADGGIVTGPTNALIGEAGPELIMPLNDINRFIGGLGSREPQLVIADARIAGTDIVLAFNRTTKRINRTQ